MLEFWKFFFGSGSFIPHGHCYLWQTKLVWLHVASDSIIAIAYFSIPITLLYFISKRKDLPFDWIFAMIITERHKGDLQCISAPGRGAEFMIKIPVSMK